MFGVLASGRLVNTNVQQAGENTFLLAIDGAESINHVVVFLTGQVPFSEGYGGSIYFGWPSSTGTGLDGVSWQYLGYIVNEKPSAIFKIASVKPKDLSANPFGQDFGTDTMMVGANGGVASATPTHQSALIGISVEPLSEIVQKTPSTDTQASTVDSFTEFSQKMLENFFNYASSFAVDYSSQLKPSETYVPFSVLQQWYTNFQRRLQANPNFWKTM